MSAGVRQSMSVPPALNPAGNERNPRAYFGSHLSSTDQRLLSGPAPRAAGTFPQMKKIKTHFAQTYSPMPPSMYLNTVTSIICFIHAGSLQDQHLQPAFPTSIYIYREIFFTLSIFHTQNNSDAN